MKGPPRAQGPVVWPGIFDGDHAQCLCTWSILNGRRQVKVRNSICPVRHTVGEPPARGRGDTPEHGMSLTTLQKSYSVGLIRDDHADRGSRT